VGDTLVALNSGGPKYFGDLFRYEQVAVLQQDPNRPESLMYMDIRFLRTEKGFFRGRDGYFYVGDSGGARIAVFDPEGRYLRSIGGRGEGPGEFSFMELYALDGDVLTALDHSLRRTTRFRTDGTLLEVLPGRMPWEDDGVVLSLAGRSHYDQEGSLWMGAGFTARTRDGELIGEGRTREINILWSFATPGAGRGGQSRPPVPFVARPFARPMPDGGVLLTETVEPVLWWYHLDGSVRLKIDLGIPRRRIDEQDSQGFTTDLDNRLAAADGAERERLTLERAAVPYPRYGSLWNYLSVDDERYLWLEAHEEGFERTARGGGCTYYVISIEGEFMGTTRAPAVPPGFTYQPTP
jgi:hypothetical protein